MATYSSTLAMKIPWTEEPSAGYCPWGRIESDMTERLHFHFHLYLLQSEINQYIYSFFREKKGF